MALLTATDTWSSAVTIPTGGQSWQARSGSFMITTKSTPDPEDGHMIPEGYAINLQEGDVVYYKRYPNEDNDTLVRIDVL